MANAEINDLTAKTTPDETDELEIQETAGGLSKKITRANFIPDSSETVKGKVELATTAEATTGTDTVRAVTPAGVKAVADLKANDNAVVKLTGDQTVAGVKTFSSDPIIPDEVYGVGWNGSLEPATKNALYDKIETIGGSSYTDENAQDAVGTILADSGDIDFTYDDATPAITAVVKNDTITYAKMQNVSATDRILGRDTAGAGDVEELDATAVKTMLALVKGDVGLGNVDDTSDANKPVSTAQQTALDAKVSKAGDTMTGDLELTSGTASLLAWNIKGNNTSSNAGTLSMAGEDGAGVASGNVEIYGGYGQSGNANGGSVIIAAGTAEGSGTDGTIQLQDGDSGFSAKMNLTALTADRTITFPDTAVNLGDIASKANDADVVHDTGDETIAGVKTFSSDPLIPDEAYDATAWNGSLEPPTKNAVRDKFESLSAGGQTTFDAIVAASGGTHTTLGAAIAAASANWRILVLDNCTETGAITSSLAGLTIVGAGKGTTVTLGANALTLSGANVSIYSLGFTMTTGNIIMSGATGTLDGCYVNTASNGSNNVTLSGNGARMINSEVNTTYASSSNTPYVLLSGTLSQLINTKFTMTNLSNSSTTASTISLTGSAATVNGCFFSISAVNNGSTLIYANAGYNKVVSNHTYTTVANNALFCNMAAATSLIANNTGFWCGGWIQVASSNVQVTGNNVTCQSVSGVTGINFTNAATGCLITGNTLNGSGSATSFGIYMGNANNDDNIISDNILTGWTTLVRIDAGDRNSIISNNFKNYTTQIVDTGTSTTIIGNTPVASIFDKRNVYMKNTSGGALAVGDVVVFKSVAAGDEVTTTTTAGDSKVFGVLTEAISSNAYGSVQTLGKTTSVKVNGTTDIAIGDYLSTYTTAGIAQKATAGQMAFAIALEAYTTDDSNGVLDALIVTPRLI